MNSENTTLRRPVALWVIVVLFSSLMVLNIAIFVYMRFWGDLSSRFAVIYDGWTLFDYLKKFYPGLMIVIGCIGLAMLKRWALYVFGIVLAVRLWDTARLLLRYESSGDGALFILLGQLFAFSLPAIAFGYTLHLARRGMLKTTGVMNIDG